MSEAAEVTRPAPPLLPIRLGVGLAQGLALFALHHQLDAKAWPASQPELFWALMLTSLFLPLVVLGGLGGFRLRTLVAWTLAAAALLAGLAVHGVLRQGPPASGELSLEPMVFPAAAASLFIAHHLIAASDRARRLVAPYPDYFDLAWKSGVQLALAGLFTGVFWAVLQLGGALFSMIGLKLFQQTIQKDWFAFPATGLVFAGAVHLTDLRAGLTHGVRTVVLALLAWLTPLMALIAVAFLLALPFTGLEPLWKTRSAAGELLAAAVALVLLINAAYQDGDPERRPAAVLRWAGRIACVVLVPLVAIAVHALWLRIHQYGWTPERITASAGALIAACYALGYALAAVLPGPWLKRLEITNVLTALVALAVILALFTPIADPGRISVADQMARLKSGRISAEHFDFAFLRFRAGRYGMDALKALKAGKDPALATKAAAALALKFAWMGTAPPAERAMQITVYPKGRTLPEAFVKQDWSKVADYAGPCLGEGMACDAYFADLDGDGSEEILLGDFNTLWAYAKAPDGKWRILGKLDPMDCKVRDDLRAGHGIPTASHFKDLAAGGRRLRLDVTSGDDNRDLSCNSKEPAKVGVVASKVER